MLRVPLSLRAQCLRSLRTPLVTVNHATLRARSFKAARKPGGAPYAARPRQRRSEAEDDTKPSLNIPADDVEDYLTRNITTWISQHGSKVSDRLLRFGVPKAATRPILKTFARNVQSGAVFDELDYDQKQLDRIAHDLSHNVTQSLDRYLTKFLYEWASLPGGQQALGAVVPPDVISQMQTLFHAADLTHAGWEYPHTRRNPKRKFIMHVGPTNSGKTHNALRALAAAKTGMYAGPLRLLAYEIYDRLNKGQIIPLGMEPDPQAEPDSQINIDVGEGAEKKDMVVIKTGNPKYARQCNMITGEEQKIVDVNAPLLSCTVEMSPLGSDFDVAVIDEIQLIADSQRGGAWTAALLGLNARTIHLCGEEAAVPLVEAIVRQLGDEFEVNYYQRLTPLVVAEESLEGDLSRVRKGDCAVTFSRSGLFGLKQKIEEATKMRCAIAYGRLPPEIRSEQAALFNDPNSDFNVLVGSDAVGMGLNLKIKRVIFEAVAKFDGAGMRPLSVSQIKQIAGRAGRFGLHEKDSVGVVTTLHAADLEAVRKALATAAPPVRYARLQVDYRQFSKIVTALPWDSKGATIADVYQYVAKMSPLFEFQAVEELGLCFAFIDGYVDCLPLRNRLLAQNSPCPWRDQYSVFGAKSLMDIHREKLMVTVEEMLERADLLSHLNKALVLMDGQARIPDQQGIVEMLGKLETVHKVVVLYLWYTYRYAMAFPDQKKAFALRDLTELAMDWCLEVLHQMRLKAADPGSKARRTVQERRPLIQDEKEPETATEETQYHRSYASQVTRERMNAEVYHVNLVR
ncbi:P-loop containing nucleoside triphosphate hydrolase protein [Daedaleopsis nitida]|nr:P-loop containing nucleoside triphosphate hydrolase protein [Daedaleopsis nitida]